MSSPTDTPRDGEKPMTHLQFDTASDEEVSPSEMTTMDGDAEMLVEEPTESEHDRTEFEEHAAQARQISRKDVEAKDPGIEELQHSSPGLKIQVTAEERDVSQEQRSKAQTDAEDSDEIKPEAMSSRKQAAWVTEAVAAIQANKKNLLNKGAVLVILDSTDHVKSYLLDANILCKTSDDLGKLHEDAQAKSASCVSRQELSAMLILCSPSASIPELVAEALDATIESVLPPQPDAHPPAETGRTQSTRSAIAKMKAELEEGDSPPAADNSGLPGTDWPKAYESFFHIIAGKKHGISRHDLSTALPQAQGVVQIAQKYNAIGAVKSTFTSLLLDYVEHHTLYSTIGKWPSHCLNLGVALKNRLVYDEAFKHLVGNGANFKDVKVSPGLPDDVQAIVQRRSRELYSARRDVEEKLMLMSLTGTNKDEYPSQCVSQHDRPIVYDTVNIFRDWINEHIGHLRKETPTEPEPFYLCNHDDCTHVAGFYQTIVDCDYLNADEVYDGFSTRCKSESERQQKMERAAVTQALGRLKDKAYAHVKKLSESTLHLADRSRLSYLTCVEVNADDVPWRTGSDGDSDDDGLGSDED